MARRLFTLLSALSLLPWFPTVCARAFSYGYSPTFFYRRPFMHMHSRGAKLLASHATLLLGAIGAGFLCGCQGPLQDVQILVDSASGSMKSMDWGAPVKGVELGVSAGTPGAEGADDSDPVSVTVALRNRSPGPVKLLLPTTLLYASDADWPQALISMRATGGAGGRSVYFTDSPKHPRQAVTLASGEVMSLLFVVHRSIWPAATEGDLRRVELVARYRNADEQAFAVTLDKQAVVVTVPEGTKAVRVSSLWTGEVRSPTSRILVDDSQWKPARAPASQPAP